MLPQQPFPAQIILHSRNFGSFAAIRTGLKAPRGQFMAVMAADLQEAPELAIKILQILQRDEEDVVMGARDSRHDPFLSNLSSRCFWWLHKRLVMPELPEGGVDIFGCNDAVRRELVALEEAHSALIGQIYWLGFRGRTILYHRKKRETGQNAWTFRRKLAYLLDSLFAFSALPLRLLPGIGVTGVVVAVLLSLLTLILKLQSDFPVPDYAATVLAIMFFGSLNLTAGRQHAGACIRRHRRLIATDGGFQDCIILLSRSTHGHSAKVRMWGVTPGSGPLPTCFRGL